MRAFLGFLAGLVFGLGLVVSGMSNPAKVLNFLDVLGPWDPSLAFVMGGASVTAFLGYRFAWRRASPLAMPDFDIPSARDVDRPLLVGAALFGTGWGIGGFCPGPAWTALPSLDAGALVFLVAMVLGLVLGGPAKRALAPAPATQGA
ncbi:DUF6691 family protein [Jannaschia sp. W003]|uniref:DUF6691 family protein n=1 Tax=Jannaschia sp. W003 TaxID=2867012 RepID=UPI0021A71EFF|nr:DUF6691 family protein [Jannaschia sp. W003]UWQ22438.1 YeeE/YedE family protein [Jannaschia sp. W003]